MAGFPLLETCMPWTTFSDSRHYSKNVCSEYSKELARALPAVEMKGDGIPNLT